MASHEVVERGQVVDVLRRAHWPARAVDAHAVAIDIDLVAADELEERLDVLRARAAPENPCARP